MPEDNLKRRESTLHVGNGNLRTVVRLNYTCRGPFLKGKLEANKIFYSHIFDFIYQTQNSVFQESPFGYKKRLGSYNPAEQAALAQNQTFRSVVRSVYCSAIK